MSCIRKFLGLYFLELELIASIVLAGAFTIWMFRFGGSAVVNDILDQNRSAVYGTLASILGALLGFVITALSIIIGYTTNEKFEFIRSSRHYFTLWRVLLSTIKALSLATAAMVVGLIFDRDTSPQNWILCVCVFTILFSLFRLRRCIWILENVIHIIIK